MAVSIEAATATTAFFEPRRLLRRWNWARAYVLLERAAAQAHVTMTVLSQLLPFLSLAERDLPALWLSPGQRPAKETRWRWVGNRDMSAPISASTTQAEVRLMPGISASSRTSSAKGPTFSSI